jgi:signal transduction histidine kinase
MVMMKAQLNEVEVDDVARPTQSQCKGWNDTELNLLVAVSQRERSPSESEQARANDLVWREANRQLGEILDIASHELKTPLTIVKVSLQLALRQLGRNLYAEASGDAEPTGTLQGTWEMLKLMERQINRLSQSMDQLLDLSRMEAGKLELTIDRCDLTAIVSEAVAEQRLICPDRRIIYDPAAELTAPVVADARRIGQVVTNYLTNALKYSPGDQPVEVWLEVGETEARICVHDEGPGLPEAEQARIWERFQQVEGIKPQSGTDGGLGLGLYISRTIVEQYRGEVGLESAPGQGATFWCTLPLASANEEVG